MSCTGCWGREGDQGTAAMPWGGGDGSRDGLDSCPSLKSQVLPSRSPAPQSAPSLISQQLQPLAAPSPLLPGGKKTFWNSPRNPGAPQALAKFVGLWAVGFFFVLFLLDWVFSLHLFIYSIKLHGFHLRDSLSFHRLLPFPWKFWGKPRAPAEQEDEGFTPILPLAWKETPLGWHRGNFCHSKSLNSF